MLVSIDFNRWVGLVKETLRLQLSSLSLEPTHGLCSRVSKTSNVTVTRDTGLDFLFLFYGCSMYDFLLCTSHVSGTPLYFSLPLLCRSKGL